MNDTTYATAIAALEQRIKALELDKAELQAIGWELEAHIADLTATQQAQATPSALELKSKHLWPVVDSWGTAESDEPDSQRWVIKAMVDDLRALEAENIDLSGLNFVVDSWERTATSMNNIIRSQQQEIAELQAQASEWVPIEGVIHLQISGQLQTLSAHRLSDWSFPPNMAICKRVDAPQATKEVDNEG